MLTLEFPLRLGPRDASNCSPSQKYELPSGQFSRDLQTGAQMKTSIHIISVNLNNNVSLKLNFCTNKPPLNVSLFDHARVENILCYK